MYAAKGVPAQERNLFPGRSAYPPRAAPDVLGWDVHVLKGVELPRLLLPLSALDPEDTHHRRLRVAHNHVLGQIRVDEER